MAESCLLYYITDRTAFPGDETKRRSLLLDKIAEAITHNVDYIQLREKDLSARDLESLAREAAYMIQTLKTENRELRTALLINSRTDVALAASADGVHLPANDIFPEEATAAWRNGTRGSVRELSPRSPLIAVSCHSPQEVFQAAANQATLALFAPVFEKIHFPNSTPTGLKALRHACRAPIPVLALGGVTLPNARSCLEAGAAGIAAIRLFQENDIGKIVTALRS